MPDGTTLESQLPGVANNAPYGLITARDAYIGGDLVLGGDIITDAEQIVTAVSNGTTEVSVFGASGLPYAITITGVYLIARDTTATNITVEAPASTVVCTIAKGATAGALVGASSLANNTNIPAGTNVIIDGSSTGIAQVFITYKRAS